MSTVVYDRARERLIDAMTRTRKRERQEEETEQQQEQLTYTGVNVPCIVCGHLDHPLAMTRLVINGVKAYCHTGTLVMRSRKCAPVLGKFRH